MKYLVPDPNFWIADIETDGLQPTKIWCVCVRNIQSGEERTFYDSTGFKDFLRQDMVLVGHNLLSFDVPVLNRLWGCEVDLNRCCDTLVLSYLYNPALVEGHSLDAWGNRLKYPKTDHTDWSQLTDEMVLYCQNDVRLTEKLYTALTNKMRGIGYSELSCQIEHKIHIVIDKQISTGCWFNVKRGQEFRDFLRQRQSDLTREIQDLFPPKRTLVKTSPIRRRKDGSPHSQLEKDRLRYHELIINSDDTYDLFNYIPFNIGSPKQRVERLLELGWKPLKFTPTGQPKVDEDALLAFAEASGRQELKALAEWIVLQGRISMLAGNEKTGSLGWLGNVTDHGNGDTRIHGKVLSCGAASRRMIHSQPNQANAPSVKKAKYGKEMRSLWGVQPGKGKVLVGYDAKGLETECLKHWLNNPKANEVLAGDIHTDNARDMSNYLGRPVDREWAAKTGWYAWMFGCYPNKIMEIVKCSFKEAEYIHGELFPNRIPGLKKLLDNVHYEYRTNNGRIACIDGGYVIAPSLNASLNYKIQPTGAVVMKLTSILLDEEIIKQSIPALKCLDIHDEAQFEVETSVADSFGSLAVESITRAGDELGFNVRLTGSYAIGPDWSMTH